MRILAIETSCDETSVSVLEIRGSIRRPVFNILSNIVASQVKIHAPWGGVVPNLAKREHQANLTLILKKALKESNLLISNFQFPISKQILTPKYQILNSILEREPELLKKLTPFFKKYKAPEIDLIAVTSGPGLEPALWVGINFAKALAMAWNKPLIPINHMEGHLFSVFLKKNRKKNLKFKIENLKFPAVALLVSGGHTQLVLVKNWLKYKLLGETLDDAAGEAFDKVAKMLKLGYPGGPVIAAEAAKSEIRNKFKILNSKFKIQLPRPILNSKDYNFSFSGLKTAVLYLLKDLEKKIPDFYNRKDLILAICVEFQQAVIDVLIKKTIRSAQEYKAKTIILGGGVAANKELRLQMAEAVKNLKIVPIFLMPEMEFTGDNAAMIALAAYFHWQKNKKIGGISKIAADSNLRLK